MKIKKYSLIDFGNTGVVGECPKCNFQQRIQNKHCINCQVEFAKKIIIKANNE